MPNVADLIGVLGFILAAFSLIWQIHSNRADRREQLRLTLGIISPRPDRPGDRFATLYVVVSNIGHVPVYLQSVSLWVSDEGLRIVRKRKWIAWLTAKRNAGSWSGIRLSRDDDHENPIAPGDSCKFVLSQTDAPQAARIATLPHGSVCISAQTKRGVERQESGEHLHRMLAMLGQAIELERQPARE